MTGGVLRRSDWGQCVLFVVLAVGLSTTWADWASLHGLLKTPASSGIYASVAQVGVLFSALVVMGLFGRAAFRRVGWRLGPLWAYGAVVIAVGLVVALSIIAALAAGALRLAPPAHMSATALLVNAPVLLLFTCVFSFCEEFGWRGFLLPKLLPLGVGRALVATGLAWFVWEAPLVWFGMLDGEIGRVSMPLTLGLHLIQNVAIAVAFGYLRLRFASVFLPAFAHGLLNTFGGLCMTLLVETDPVMGDFDGVAGTAILAVAGVFAWMLTQRAERQGLIHEAVPGF